MESKRIETDSSGQEENEEAAVVVMRNNMREQLFITRTPHTRRRRRPSFCGARLKNASDSARFIISDSKKVRPALSLARRPGDGDVSAESA